VCVFACGVGAHRQVCVYVCACVCPYAAACVVPSADKSAPRTVNSVEVGRTESTSLAVRYHKSSSTSDGLGSGVTVTAAASAAAAVIPSVRRTSWVDVDKRRLRSSTNIDGRAEESLNTEFSLNSRRLSSTGTSSLAGLISLTAQQQHQHQQQLQSSSAVLSKGGLCGRVDFVVPLEVDWSTLWIGGAPSHFTFSLCTSKTSSAATAEGVISDA
jgi:hypothetical protein